MSAHENHLLSSLKPSDFALLERHLEPMPLTLRLVFEHPNKRVERICFPHSGFLSVVATAERDRKIEVGIIGQDGMSGLSVVHGTDRSPAETFVQMTGTGSTISADVLRDAMQRSPSMHRCFLLYAQAFSIQASYTALSKWKS